MMAMNNISISLLLELTLVFILLFGSSVLFSRLILPSMVIKPKKAHYKKWSFRILFFIWIAFISFYLYRLFQNYPGFTVLFLILLFVPFWNHWKNLTSGLLIKWDNKPIPGDKIEIRGKSGKILRISFMHVYLQTDEGTIIAIPNQLLTSAGYSRILNTQDDVLIEIRVRKSMIKKLGGFEQVRKVAMSSPWSHPKRQVEITDMDDNEVLLKAWASSPHDRKHFHEFLRSRLVESK